MNKLKNKLVLVFALFLMSATFVLAHREDKGSYEECPMYEQMEQVYGDEFMENMHNRMHAEFKNDEQFPGMHDTMGTLYGSNFWQRMMLWMRW